jgi:hypothetical protein
VQQGMGLSDVVDVGRRGDHGVGEARFGIDADVRLHAEVMEWSPLPDPATGGQSDIGAITAQL